MRRGEAGELQRALPPHLHVARARQPVLGVSRGSGGGQEGVRRGSAPKNGRAEDAVEGAQRAHQQLRSV
eukprot:84819-Prorocentrum_minimum.AAC.1